MERIVARINYVFRKVRDHFQNIYATRYSIKNGINFYYFTGENPKYVYYALIICNVTETKEQMPRPPF